MLGNSPAKKLNFAAGDKENCAPFEGQDDVAETPIVSKAVTKPMTKAEEIREMEASEPLLQENKQRFVLFPLKYHEVCLIDA